MFPLQLAYVKSDLLSIYIPTQKSCDRVLRQAVNYDNRHNKNSPSVDRLLPDFIEGFVDRPVHLCPFNCLPLIKDYLFTVVSMYLALAFPFARTNIVKKFQLIILIK